MTKPGAKYILEKNAFSGGISVSYLRGDNPLLSFKKEGTPLMYVLKDTGSNMAVGMGGCIIRDVIIGNKILSFINCYTNFIKEAKNMDFFKVLY